MEISDEYQDMSNPGGGRTMANIPLGNHHQTSESPMSHQEEDLSDPDLQDEESGEELLQQPLQGNTHSSTDSTQIGSTPSTPLNHLNTLMSVHHPQFLSKFKMEQPDMDLLNNKSSLEALQVAMSSGGFNLPFSFPPPAAFLTPQHQNNHHQINTGGVSAGGGGGAGNAIASSASSLSSESSQGSTRHVSEAREGTGQTQNNNTNSQQHQTSWSFEEQFKQVRQLYEINDDPKRKEFLDDLFSFMQKRGTPINRLPIMAKSVLDLYELYNLVIARGGLVDVINKKLWQEIIKGLHLPSSITSAAFTLRTQYMKYLYPYECEKQRLSTQAELQAAIDGNRREGRRSSYAGSYAGAPGANESMIQRNPHTPSSLALHTQMSPLSLVTNAGGQHHGPQSMINGSGALTPLTHYSHLSAHSQGLLGPPPIAAPLSGPPGDFDSRMVEYVKLLSKELRHNSGGSPPPMIQRRSAASPSDTSPRDNSLSAFEFSRMALWNLYNNNTPYSNVSQQPPLSPQPSHSPHRQPSSPEQREALDLGLRSSPMSSLPVGHSTPDSGMNLHIKKDQEPTESTGPPSTKRLLIDEDENNANDKAIPVFAGTHIKISNRGDSKNGDNSLVVSMELNGVMYQGVLFAQGDNKNRTNANNNNTKTRGVLL